MIKAFEKIHIRLSLVLLGVFLILSCTTVYIVLHSSNKYQQQTLQTLHKDLAQHVVDHYLLFKDGKPDLEQAKHTFHDLMILGPNFEFYLLDEKGEILSFSAKPHLVKKKRINLEAINAFLGEAKLDEAEYGENPRSENENKIFSVAPIVKADKTLGYLYVIIGSDLYDSISQALSENKALSWGATILLLTLLFGFLVTLILTGYIIKPLSKLAEQSQMFCKKGFKHSGSVSSDYNTQLEGWSKTSGNEIHILGSTFRELLVKLEEQYSDVITLDELRKELLAHVSHDLRTPLASLLGYLETWQLQSDKLSHEDSKKYIAIAHRNAKTISRLVEQLFELAHLDSGNVQINMERFSIADLIQDVLQKFAIVSEKTNITLAVTPQKSSIQVFGDIEKLERVFTNLIENAIRHTKPGGSVTVRLSPQGKFVGIEVSDTGIGIPEEDLPHVFDAHYKAGNSVRGNSRHGGIGLAITKRIVELHKSNIQVRSKANDGTTFSFSLAAGA